MRYHWRTTKSEGHGIPLTFDTDTQKKKHIHSHICSRTRRRNTLYNCRSFGRCHCSFCYGAKQVKNVRSSFWWQCVYRGFTGVPPTLITEQEELFCVYVFVWDRETRSGSTMRASLFLLQGWSASLFLWVRVGVVAVTYRHTDRGDRGSAQCIVTKVWLVQLETAEDDGFRWCMHYAVKTQFINLQVPSPASPVHISAHGQDPNRPLSVKLYLQQNLQLQSAAKSCQQLFYEYK